MWLIFSAASKVKYFILAEIHEWLHKTGLKKNITSSTKCLVPPLTFAVGVNSTPSSTQRSSMSYLHLPLFYPKILMSYLHLPFFLLHIAVLPLSFQHSILTYTQLYPLCSSFHGHLNKLFPSQQITFLSIGAIYCLISNFQVGPDSLHFGEKLYPPASKTPSTVPCQSLITLLHTCSLTRPVPISLQLYKP